MLSISRFWSGGGSGRDRESVEKSVQRASGIPFKECVELKLTKLSERPNDSQFGWRITGQIEKDDVLPCSFYARCPESTDESAIGKFTVGSTLKRGGRYFSPFTKTYTVGSAWKLFLVPFMRRCRTTSATHALDKGAGEPKITR